jgi:glycosyltransferase involved in cell wall biosynthesis
MKPRVLFVARTRYRLPPDETLQRRFDALDAELDWRQLATAGGGRGTDPRLRLAPVFPLRPLDGLAFYAALPFRVARELRDLRPDVVVAQGAPETVLTLLARRLARVSTRVVFDVHGDPRTATRLYGSSRRRLVNPLSDALSRLAVRRADGIRTVSGYTTGLVRDSGREPTAVFPAFMDLAPFLAREPVPLPDAPEALFVGVLERYKAIDVLAAAWPSVVGRVPDSTLHVVGRGALADVVRRLVAEHPGSVRWTEQLPTAGIVEALDESTLLVLPSRAEGMGRVVVEAFCRGRAVVGARFGGITDLVVDGLNGILVTPEDPEALADALVRVLSDTELAARLGGEGRRGADRWIATPEEFARRLRELVDRTLAGRA